MIVLGATCAPYKTDDPLGVLSWLTHAEAIKASHPDGVQVFCALEVDGRGHDVYGPLRQRLDDLGAVVWTFSLDDGARTLTSHGRLVRICTGRNLVTQYGCDSGATHILFADTDVAIPPDALPRLLELDWPMAGGKVPTYCLDGPRVPEYAYDVREHMNTAGFLLVERQLFRRLRWRWDAEAGQTDDPAYHADAVALGFPTFVRHDVVARHHPESIAPLEWRGHDLALR